MCSALWSVNDKINVFETVQQLKKVKLKNELASYKKNARTTASQNKKMTRLIRRYIYMFTFFFFFFFSSRVFFFFFPTTFVSKKKIFCRFLPLITKEDMMHLSLTFTTYLLTLSNTILLFSIHLIKLITSIRKEKKIDSYA